MKRDGVAARVKTRAPPCISLLTFNPRSLHILLRLFLLFPAYPPRTPLLSRFPSLLPIILVPCLLPLSRASSYFFPSADFFLSAFVLLPGLFVRLFVDAPLCSFSFSLSLSVLRLLFFSFRCCAAIYDENSRWRMTKFRIKFLRERNSDFTPRLQITPKSAEGI